MKKSQRVTVLILIILIFGVIAANSIANGFGFSELLFDAFMLITGVICIGIYVKELK